MAGSQYLEPPSDFGRGPQNSTKERASAAAQQMQQTVKSQAAKSGVAVPPYQLVELIGKGAFGRVYKSVHTPKNQLVAVKIIDVDAADFKTKGEDTVKDVLRETGALRALKESKARNINIIYDAFFFASCVWIVSEYCPGGSVRTLMRATPEPGLNEEYIIPIARELAEALKWVHHAGIIHRDVKAANILVCEDGRVQLCDFGVAGILESKLNKRSTILGTPHYMAPEILDVMDGPLGVEYGNEVDIWAFGCTLYELATGLPPNARVAHENLSHVVKSQVPRLKGGKHSAALQDLVEFCIERSPTKRPSIEMVQEHPYIVNSSRRYPTSSLKRLLYDYYVWERSGGQRASLFMPGGAQAPELGHGEEDDWNFSTTDFFKDSVAATQSTLHDYNNNGINSAQDTQHDRAHEPSTRKLEAHPRIPLNPLERLFNPNDNYNYLERGQRPNMVVPSDLPLREHNENSSRRETLIDAGAFDASTGIATIPDLSTIRGKQRFSRFFRDSDDESEETMKFQESTDGETRRATKDWKFPSLSDTEATAGDRRKTQDWKFPLLNVPDESGDTRRKTKDWKFPVMTSGPGTGGSGSVGPANTASIGEARPALMHAHTEPVDSAAFGGHRGQAEAGHLATSPHSIDLDEYFSSPTHRVAASGSHLQDRSSFATFLRGEGGFYGDPTNNQGLVQEATARITHDDMSSGIHDHEEVAHAASGMRDDLKQRRESTDSDIFEPGVPTTRNVKTGDRAQPIGQATRGVATRADTDDMNHLVDKTASVALEGPAGESSGSERLGHNYNVSSESNTTDDDQAVPLPAQQRPALWGFGPLPAPPDPAALEEGASKGLLMHALTTQLVGLLDGLGVMRTNLEAQSAEYHQRNERTVRRREQRKAARERARQAAAAARATEMTSMTEDDVTPTGSTVGASTTVEGSRARAAGSNGVGQDEQGLDPADAD